MYTLIILYVLLDSFNRIVVAGMLTHLKVGAEVSARKKKLLQPNPVSPWELRIDRFRVFYSVGENNEVKIVAVGHKEHNLLIIRGKQIEL